ncbi:RHS repeat-associated core domain-containing protein, partial [Pantoea sp. B65]|uniref:RHS repeat-associated core domain-containing protein n=1 Tax=Pantoea sp. B65 TaxID=2813359 RepID=UPI0039B69AAB
PEIYWFHNQVNGMPERLTDAEGGLRWEGHNSAWGKLLRETSSLRGTGYAQNLRMQGQYLDRETGLHYNLFRYFDPDCAGFTQPDPIGLAGGLNLYAYAPNALSWIDPLELPREYGTTKRNGKYTEPDLPSKVVAEQGDIKIVHYTRSGDHGPAHLHVKGGGPETKIGQAGKPIKGSPSLTSKQQVVVDVNRSVIRKTVDKIQRWFRYQNLE